MYKDFNRIVLRSQLSPQPFLNTLVFVLYLMGKKKCSSGSNSSERRGKIGIASLVINPFMPFYPLIHFYAPLVF